MSHSKTSELRRGFNSTVPEDIEVGHPTGSEKLSYEQYLELDESLRSGDERPVVDTAFTPRLLRWLDYEESDWKYNDIPKGKSGDRPDFVVRPTRATAFVVEDKNTTEEFRADHVEQLQKYTAGTQGYAIWTNARIVLALRFYPGGSYDILARIPVDTRQLSLEEADDTALELFRTLFEKERFVEMPGILDRICLDEDEWEQVVRPLDNEPAQRKFIEETRELLDKLTLAALVQIERAAEDVEEGQKDVEETVAKLERQGEQLLQVINGLPDELLDPIRSRLDELLANPNALSEEELRKLKPDQLGTLQEREWNSKAFALVSTVADLREREVQRHKSRKIHQSFEAWRDRYRIIEGEDMTDARRRNAYAEQVAYTFFIRLLLARILEDKGAVNRLISDGGLKAWREITEPSVSLVKEDEVGLHGRALLDVLFQSVSKFYQHFFNQPVFDWFNPDDYLLALALERLSTFSFADINRDILGFAYEAYVERAFRNEKGHFLTRGEIVEYILDEAEYEGREIIGRKVLDPAAGSGSFLVHAARRLRDEIEGAVQDTTEEEAQERVAQEFIRRLQEDFVGLEINPFSCYLSELNLLLQALDDILYLWQEAGTRESIDQFKIYNTDSLTLPQSILQNQPTLSEDGATLGHDQAKEVKLEGEASFDFVIMNPPYINRGIQHDLLDLTKIPFYNVLFGGGDTNYYHAFIRLANHYVADRGVVALICPLQLYGDRSAGGIRRWLSASLSGSPPDDLKAEWRVRSLTRFYSRTVLFENVIQAVSVSVWERHKDQTEDDVGEIVVAGGASIEEARSNRLRYGAERVVSTDPITARKRKKRKGSNGGNGSAFTDEWHHAWAVVADEDRLKVWEQLRDASVTDLATWTRRDDAEFFFRKGDVNMTRTKPLRPLADGGKVSNVKTPVSTAGSKDLLAFGPYEQNTELDADADVSSMAISKKKKADADRERRDRVERIANLSATEAVCVIKEISGIEPARPISGSLYHRGGNEPLVCFEDTLQVIFTPLDKHQYLTEAIFALLVSSTANFIFSMFSTNQHVGTYEIQRLPIPELREDQLRVLADLGKAVQLAGEQFWDYKEEVHAGGGLMELEPDPDQVLSNSGVKTETLGTARLRGHITIEGPDYHVSTLVDRGDVAFPDEAKQPDYADAARLFLARTDEKREEADTNLHVPVPAEADEFLKQLEQAKQELRRRLTDCAQALATLDRYVLSLYQITSLQTCELVGAGMPWASTGTEWATKVRQELASVKLKSAGTASPVGAAPNPRDE